MSETHTPIRVNTLRGDLQIPFDVFVKVAGKFILYCRSGSTFEGERLERLKSKKLKFMYVRSEDDIAYRQYLETSIDTAFKGAGKSPQTRAEVIQGFEQAAAEQFMEDPASEFAYHHVESSVRRLTDLLRQEPALIPVLLKLPNSDKSITHHGVNVATLASAMAHAESVKDEKFIATMALGCLIHDIEHFHSGLEIAGPPQAFPAADAAIYRSHPLDGASRLQKSRFVDQLVFKIVSQHEEHIDGSGFPQGLREKDMDPLVMIAATANAYDRLVAFEHLDARTALKTLLIDKLGAYPLQALKTLQSILKIHSLV